MAFRVRDGLFSRAVADHLIEDPPDIPLTEGLFLDGLDPVVRQTHAQAGVKTDAALGDRPAHARHAAHILGDAIRLRFDFLSQVHGKLQVGDRVHVRVHGEIHLVVHKRGAQAVVMIEHAGDAVKAEAVKMIFFQPEAHVGKQEMDHAGFAVIKHPGIPGRMIACLSFFKELAVGSVKARDSFRGVLDRVGVDDVQQHGQAQLMGPVDQGLQFVRRPVAGGSGVKIADLIAERAVIRVLHDGHQLHRVIAVFFDSGKNVPGKLRVGADPLLLRSHADVGFVNQRRNVPGRVKIPVRPGKRLFRRPDRGVKGLRLIVLHDIGGVQRNPVLHAAVAGHLHFDQGAVRQSVLAGQLDFPVAVVQAF